MYLEDIKETKITNKAGLKFYSGILNNIDIVLVKAGVGKVSNAMCSQILIDLFDVKKIIFTGVAGALNHALDIYDIVISKDCIQHDVDATTMGFKKGQIPYSNLLNFDADSKLINIAELTCKELGYNHTTGRMLSGDQFINNTEFANSLRNEFKGDCVDMESAAIGHVCELNQIPFLIIRSISDKADHSSHVDFPKFCAEAAIKSHKIVLGILNKL